jgi:hypothetical protein
MHGHVFYSKEETILENDHNTKEVKKMWERDQAAWQAKRRRKSGGKKGNEGLRNQRSPLHRKSGVRFLKAAQTQNASPWMVRVTVRGQLVTGY